MEAYDQLPGPLRLAVRQALHDPNTEPLLATWHKLRWQGADLSTARIFARQVAVWDMLRLNQFAATFEERHKTPYPHVAARATILYSEPVPD